VALSVGGCDVEFRCAEGLANGEMQRCLAKAYAVLLEASARVPRALQTQDAGRGLVVFDAFLGKDLLPVYNAPEEGGNHEN
jgi:hypothetical protein